MKSKKVVIRVICIVLAVLILCLGVGLIVKSCYKKPTKKKKVIKKVVVVQEDPNQIPMLPNNFGIVDDPNSSLDDTYERVRRKLSLKSNLASANYVPEYKVTEANWAGPQGYVIVASKDVRACRDAAKLLQAYFKETTGIDVPCVTDAVAPVDKEILVGDTNRRTSQLKETEFAVSLDGNKLVFEGGHYAMTETAVDWFTSFEYKAGKVNLLAGEIKDFKPSVTFDGKTLNYVWGDEHGGNRMNPQKWCYHKRMGGNPDVMFQDKGDSCVKVNEGQLKISAGRYYNMFDPTRQYQTNISITSYQQMSFVQGYCEVRAKIPLKPGAWPSYWFLSDDGLNNSYDKYDCYLEIDFIEVLEGRNKNNLHKYYKGDHPRYKALAAMEKYKGKKINLSSWNNSFITDDNGKTNPSIKPWAPEEPLVTSEEYHVHGMYWTDDKLAFYADGENYWTFDLTYNYDGYEHLDGTWTKHFTDMPVYPIIDNSILTPKIEENTGSPKVDPKLFPYEYFIDYSRYYQEQGVGQINFAPENY